MFKNHFVWLQPKSFIHLTSKPEPSNTICLSILAHPSCEGIQFQCHSDGECIPQAWVCDDEEDCDDGSDEHQQCRKLWPSNESHRLLEWHMFCLELV